MELFKSRHRLLKGEYETSYKVGNSKIVEIAKAKVYAWMEGRNACDDRPYASITGVYTDYKFRGQGLQNLIFKEIINDYHHLELRLDVYKDNRSAIGLYLKHGFIVSVEYGKPKGETFFTKPALQMIREVR